jgi:hypothetical protein
MPDGEWIRTREDGRKSKFTYLELPENGAFSSAQIEGNEVVYSIILTEAKKRFVGRMLKAVLRTSFRRRSSSLSHRA